MKKKTYAEKADNLWQEASQKILGKQAVGIFNTDFYSLSQLQFSRTESLDGSDRERCILFLNVQRMIPTKSGGFEKVHTRWYAAFDMKKIAPNSIVTLYVPKEKIGLFSGKWKWQLKEWCKELNVKYIHVVAMD